VRAAVAGAQVTDEFVTAQVFRLGRGAVLTQIVRGCAGEQARVDDAPRNEMRLPDRAHAHHQVHFLSDEIHYAVVELYLELQLRIARRELP